MKFKGVIGKHVWGNKLFSTQILPTFCFLATAFFLGKSIAGAVEENQRKQDITKPVNAVIYEQLQQDRVAKQVESYTKCETWGLLFTENWGLGFGQPGAAPTGNSTPEELAKYHAYYLGDTKEKKIYLTFDCGYENGNTEAILDALKKHQATAAFFVVGHYLESAPDLVNRMVEEGHMVGNHTYHHPDMSKIADQTAFAAEMDAVREKYQEVTGKEMPMYYRPPQGKYSLSNLQMASDMGYSTFFWSLAYVDWNVDKQPSHEEAMKKLTGRIHPGAVVLLHNTSRTNAEILDELLGKWEEMGYTFGTLDEISEIF